jgi:ribosome-associated translation inhibitor RaiA
MKIEFQTPYGKVPEKLVSEIRNEIIELTHINKNISKALVLLKEDEAIISTENKICEIRLSVYGHDLFAHARTENFKNSSKEVIKDLKKRLMQREKKQKETIV